MDTQSEAIQAAQVQIDLSSRTESNAIQNQSDHHDIGSDSQRQDQLNTSEDAGIYVLPQSKSVIFKNQDGSREEVEIV